MVNLPWQIDLFNLLEPYLKEICKTSYWIIWILKEKEGLQLNFKLVECFTSTKEKNIYLI